MTHLSRWALAVVATTFLACPADVSELDSPAGSSSSATASGGGAVSVCGDGLIDADEECDPIALAPYCSDCRYSAGFCPETEPNDVYAYARPDACTTWIGELAADDTDIFPLAVPDGGSVSAVLASLEMTGCPDFAGTVELLAPGGEVVFATGIDVGTGCPSLGPDIPDATNLPAGVYGVRVRSTEGGGGYALSVEAAGPECGNTIWEVIEACDTGDPYAPSGCSPGCDSGDPYYLNDEVEPNDTAATASTIGLWLGGEGMTAPGDVDYYTFTAPAGGTIHVEACGTFFHPALDVALLGPGEEVLMTPDGTSEMDCLTFTRTSLESGGYYLRVVHADPPETYPYRLYTQIRAPGCSDGSLSPREDCETFWRSDAEECTGSCAAFPCSEGELYVVAEATGLPLLVPDDGNPVAVDVDVRHPGEVRRVAFRIDLEHAQPSDIEIRAVAPRGGDAVIKAAGVPKIGANLEKTVFSSKTDAPFPGPTPAPFTGVFGFPSPALELIYVPSEGKWRVELTDVTPEHEGRLLGARVILCVAPP